MKVAILISLCVLAVNVKADGFTGVEGVSFKDRLDTRKGWTHVRDEDGGSFFSHDAPNTPYLGLVPTAELAWQSARLKSAVGFVLRFQPRDCGALRRALEAKFGPSEEISHHEIEWLGRITDLSLDTADGQCQLFATDRRFDDTHDVYRSR